MDQGGSASVKAGGGGEEEAGGAVARNTGPATPANAVVSSAISAPGPVLASAPGSQTSPSFGLSLSPSPGGDFLTSLNNLSIAAQFTFDALSAEVEKQKTLVIETVSNQIIAPVNLAPTAGSGISRTTNEDKSDFTINLLEGVTDPDGDALSVRNFSVTSGEQSALSLSGNSLLVSPATFNSLNQGSSESVTFAFDVVDPGGLAVSQTGSIVFEGRNDAPTVSGQLSMSIKVSNTGTFLVERFAGGTGTLAQADALVAAANLTASANRSTINMRDSSGGAGRFGSSDGFPGASASDNINNFAIKATGSFSVGSSGTFTIFTHTDDGHRVKVDGNTIRTDDRNHGNTDFFTPISLSAGSHSLEIVYWEVGGGATLEAGIGAGSLSSFNSSTIQLLTAAVSEAMNFNLASGVIDADTSSSLSVSDFTLSSGSNSGLTQSGTSLATDFGSFSSTQNAIFTFNINDGSGGSVAQKISVDVAQSGDSNDTIDFSGSGTQVTLQSALDDIEIIVGTNFDDTLLGGSGAQTISGGIGADIVAGGAGNDTLNGGDGDDIFQISSASDITNGGTFNGGSGNDSLVLTSTSISSLVFPVSPVTFSSLETFDLSGGASGGVVVSVDGADLTGITTFIGDGTADQLNVINGDFTVGSSQSLDGIETVKVSQSNTAQDVTINGAVTGIELIQGTVSSASVADDDLIFSGSRDFSGVTLTDIDEFTLADGASTRQTLGLNASSNLGLAEIEDFTSGSGSTSDVLDYKSGLVSGDGTVISASSNFILTDIGSADRSTDIITNNKTGLIEFEANKLAIDLTGSTTAQITNAAEALLESVNASSNLTGSSAQVTQGGINTDTLLIFHEADNDAVIIRYQEGNTSEADFSGELSVVAIFDSISHTASNLFEDANII
jgi:hypothetical protein